MIMHTVRVSSIPHTHTLQGKLTDSCPLSGHMTVRLIDTLSNQFACEKVKNDSYHWIIFAVSRCTQLLCTIRIPYYSCVHIFEEAVVRPAALTKAENISISKCNFTFLFDSNFSSLFFTFFFSPSLTLQQAAVLYYSSIPDVCGATHLHTHAYTYISQQWRSITLRSLISEAALS